MGSQKASSLLGMSPVPLSGDSQTDQATHLSASFKGPSVVPWGLPSYLCTCDWLLSFRQCDSRTYKRVPEGLSSSVFPSPKLQTLGVLLLWDSLLLPSNFYNKFNIFRDTINTTWICDISGNGSSEKRLLTLFFPPLWQSLLLWHFRNLIYLRGNGYYFFIPSQWKDSPKFQVNGFIF